MVVSRELGSWSLEPGKGQYLDAFFEIREVISQRCGRWADQKGQQNESEKSGGDHSPNAQMHGDLTEVSGPETRKL